MNEMTDCGHLPAIRVDDVPVIKAGDMLLGIKSNLPVIVLAINDTAETIIFNHYTMAPNDCMVRYCMTGYTAKASYQMGDLSIWDYEIAQMARQHYIDTYDDDAVTPDQCNRI